MHELRRLVALLADGKFHSGEALGATLGLKRSTVWNRVQALGALGLDVFAVRGRGYRLARSLEPLDQDRIVAELDPRRAGGLAGLEVLLEVDSTNRHLAEAARRGLPDPYACLAEGQTAGRGRGGRRWVSPFGRNVYLSVLRRFRQPPEAIQGLGLAVGAAAAEAVAGLGVADVGLKWPNDLMWRGRKLAGTLLEMAGEGTGPWTLVAGIGMNVDMTPASGAAIDQPWTDLATALGEPPSRNRVAGRILDALLEAMDRYEAEGLASFVDAWRERDVTRDREVEVRVGERTICGVARGIDGTGAFLVSVGSFVERLSSGDVSLRGAR